MLEVVFFPELIQETDVISLTFLSMYSKTKYLVYRCNKSNQIEICRSNFFEKLNNIKISLSLTVSKCTEKMHK